ncbi:MAG TPA: hypothetical protein VEP30_13355 [Chthoniobacterales bacterium]|nr:hypothetical protein [Chthoniobacterales bacterium]
MLHRQLTVVASDYKLSSDPDLVHNIVHEQDVFPPGIDTMYQRRIIVRDQPPKSCILMKKICKFPMVGVSKESGIESLSFHVIRRIEIDNGTIRVKESTALFLTQQSNSILAGNGYSVAVKENLLNSFPERYFVKANINLVFAFLVQSSDRTSV